MYWHWLCCFPSRCFILCADDGLVEAASHLLAMNKNMGETFLGHQPQWPLGTYVLLLLHRQRQWVVSFVCIHIQRAQKRLAKKLTFSRSLSGCTEVEPAEPAKCAYPLALLNDRRCGEEEDDRTSGSQWDGWTQSSTLLGRIYKTKIALPRE